MNLSDPIALLLGNPRNRAQLCFCPQTHQRSKQCCFGFIPSFLHLDHEHDLYPPPTPSYLSSLLVLSDCLLEISFSLGATKLTAGTLCSRNCCRVSECAGPVWCPLPPVVRHGETGRGVREELEKKRCHSLSSHVICCGWFSSHILVFLLLLLPLPFHHPSPCVHLHEPDRWCIPYGFTHFRVAMVNAREDLFAYVVFCGHASESTSKLDVSRQD